MIRLLCFVSLLWATTARAENCTLPEVQLMSVNPGESFDVDASVRVAQRLVEAAHRDARRARDRGAGLGGELIHLGDGIVKPVAPALLAFAIRLRQLDCAMEAGRGDPTLYAEIIEQTGPFLVPPPRLILVPRPPPHPVNARRRAVGYGVGGGLLLGAGAALLSTGIAFSVYASEFRPDPPCGPQDFLCFNALDELGHLLDTEVAVLGVVAGTVAIIAGSILASRSALWVHKARLLPTLSIGPRSGFAGLQVPF